VDRVVVLVLILNGRVARGIGAGAADVSRWAGIGGVAGVSASAGDR
jgi:hypothetical protein